MLFIYFVVKNYLDFVLNDFFCLLTRKPVKTDTMKTLFTHLTH